jgi:hypothetical protein
MVEYEASGPSLVRQLCAPWFQTWTNYTPPTGMTSAGAILKQVTNKIRGEIHVVSPDCNGAATSRCEAAAGSGQPTARARRLIEQLARIQAGHPLLHSPAAHELANVLG